MRKCCKFVWVLPQFTNTLTWWGTELEVQINYSLDNFLSLLTLNTLL